MPRELMSAISLVMVMLPDAGCGRCDTPFPQETRNNRSFKSAKTAGEVRLSRAYIRPDDSQLYAINANDRADAVVKELLASIEHRYASDPVCYAAVDYSKEMKGRATRQLFPDYRFFVYQWAEKAKNPSEFVCGTVFLEAFCFDRNFQITKFRSVSNRREFGELLAKEKVKIDGEPNARLVWDAFCEVYRWPFKTDKIEQISDRVWHLGVVDKGLHTRGKAYYEVRLNENLTVESAKWTNEGARDANHDQ
jgi:hypothetical protein